MLFGRPLQTWRSTSDGTSRRGSSAPPGFGTTQSVPLKRAQGSRRPGHIYVYMNIYIYIYVYLFIYSCIIYIYTHIHTCICLNEFTLLHVRFLIFTYIRIHIHIHIHKCTCIQLLSPIQKSWNTSLGGAMLLWKESN